MCCLPAAALQLKKPEVPVYEANSHFAGDRNRSRFSCRWIAAMLLTPALWRLEPVLHMELAGHSGPSDWVFVVMWVIVAVAMFLTIRVLLRHFPSRES